MQCKHHPDRRAEHFCASCGIPLCEECAEKTVSGEYYCFQCAMFQTVSGVGTSIKDRRDKAAEKKLEKKKEWGPFRYFVVVSSALIVVMWGVVILGGQKPPAGAVDFTKNERVFLFMVDGAIKRYAHYEGDSYPERLSDLIPKYLSIRQEDVFHLKKLSYVRGPKVGYRLSMGNPMSGGMSLTLSPGGIQYKISSGGEPQ